MTDDPHPSAAQAASPTYRLAPLDEDFIMGPSSRATSSERPNPTDENIAKSLTWLAHRTG